MPTKDSGAVRNTTADGAGWNPCNIRVKTKVRLVSFRQFDRTALEWAELDLNNCGNYYTGCFRWNEQHPRKWYGRFWIYFRIEMQPAKEGKLSILGSPSGQMDVSVKRLSWSLLLWYTSYLGHRFLVPFIQGVVLRRQETDYLPCLVHMWFKVNHPLHSG